MLQELVQGENCNVIAYAEDALWHLNSLEIVFFGSFLFVDLHSDFTLFSVKI